MTEMDKLKEMSVSSTNAMTHTIFKEDISPLFSFNSHRLRIAILLMLGMYAIISMRFDLSMAVVCMVNSTAVKQNEFKTSADRSSGRLEQSSCIRIDEQPDSLGYNGTFDWSPQMQSHLLSATFYGSLATITISGVIADRVGPKICLACAASVYIIMTLLTPMLSNHSFVAFFISRVTMGLAEGFVLPSQASMAGRWFPLNERSTLAAIYTSGNQIAAALTPIISTSLCASSLGWQYIFYLFGIIAVAWLIFWLIFASNSPETNKFASERETNYLKEAIQRKANSASPPWREMMKSTAVYAALLAHFAYNFAVTILQAYLPTYFRDELHLSLTQNGIYTMLPFISQLLSKYIVGIVADRIKTKGILTPKKCAVLFQTLCSFGCALTIFCLAIFPSCERPWLAAVLLAVYGVFFSCGIAGFFTFLLSIAPQHSGTMMSLGMTAASIANVMCPLILSVVMSFNTSNTWPIMFLISATLSVMSGIFFLSYGSADIEHWALPTTDYTKRKMART